MTFADILLALVARRPFSGYRLKKWLDTEGIFIRASADQAQIYRTLRKLEQSGLIAHETERSLIGPDAKVYTATEAGAARLRELANKPYQPPARWQEADFVAWMALLGPLEPAAVLDTIDRELMFRRDQRQQLHGMGASEYPGGGVLDIDPAIHAEMRQLLYDAGGRSLDSWIEWLRQFRSRWAELLVRRGIPLPSET